MYEYKVHQRPEEESEIWPTRERSRLGGAGKRVIGSRFSEKYPLAESRVIREFAAMKKCLPSFVNILFPNGFLDPSRFDVVISLVGEIISNDYYGGRNYRFEFRIPEDYPSRPPLVECVTPIFHPNIGEEGSVGLRVLRPEEGIYSASWGWVPTDTIEGVIFKLYRLFFHPCNEDTCVLNKYAAYLYKREPVEFKSVVRRFATAAIFNVKQHLKVVSRSKIKMNLI